MNSLGPVVGLANHVGYDDDDQDHDDDHDHEMVVWPKKSVSNEDERRINFNKKDNDKEDDSNASNPSNHDDNEHDDEHDDDDNDDDAYNADNDNYLDDHDGDNDSNKDKDDDKHEIQDLIQERDSKIELLKQRTRKLELELTIQQKHCDYVELEVIAGIAANDNDEHDGDHPGDGGNNGHFYSYYDSCDEEPDKINDRPVVHDKDEPDNHTFDDNCNTMIRNNSIPNDHENDHSNSVPYGNRSHGSRRNGTPRFFDNNAHDDDDADHTVNGTDEDAEHPTSRAAIPCKIPSQCPNFTKQLERLIALRAERHTKNPIATVRHRHNNNKNDPSMPDDVGLPSMATTQSNRKATTPVLSWSNHPRNQAVLDDSVDSRDDQSTSRPFNRTSQEQRQTPEPRYEWTKPLPVDDSLTSSTPQVPLESGISPLYDSVANSFRNKPLETSTTHPPGRPRTAARRSTISCLSALEMNRENSRLPPSFSSSSRRRGRPKPMRRRGSLPPRPDELLGTTVQRGEAFPPPAPLVGKRFQRSYGIDALFTNEESEQPPVLLSTKTRAPAAFDQSNSTEDVWRLSSSFEGPMNVEDAVVTFGIAAFTDFFKRPILYKE
ncbi:hypothetical protein ACA910_004718 [Epithemia clementina (nom. ined.)]